MSPRGLLRPGGFAYLALGAALSGQLALSVDSMLPALPGIATELDMSPGSAQLTVGLLLAGYAIGQILWGWLSDWLGRRVVILAGTAGFIAATLLCAAATSGPELIVWRILQGFFSAASAAAVRAMLRDHFDGVRLARQTAAMSALFFLSPILAPQLGAAAFQAAGWRSVFLVPGVVALASLLASWRGLGESHPATRRKRHSLGTIGHSIWAMVRHPLSGLCLALQAGMWIGLLAWVSSSSLILTGHFGVSVQSFGMLFAATASVQLTGSVLCNQLLRFRSAHEVMALGGALSLAGGTLLFLATVPFGATLPWTMAALWIYMLGFGMVVPASGGMAMHAFGAMGGLAAAVLGSAQTLVGSFGSFLSALLYDGSAFSLGVCIGLSAVLASVALGMLSFRLWRHPELLHAADEPGAPGNAH